MISILYVDDEPGLLELGKIFLERDGQFAVDTVESARAALDMLGTTKYDAIIADYLMPDMDGIQLLKKVRSSGNTIPFILFTGRGREEVILQALNEGADFYIQKGGDPQPQFTELSHKVLQAVNRKRAEVALRESERKYRAIIDNMQDVVYRTDREGKLIMFSPSGVRLAGYDSEEEMLGFDIAFDTYQDPEDRKRFLAALMEKGFVENYPLFLKGRHGIPRIVTASSHFYHDDYGNVLGVEGILHDITEISKKEQELRESEERYRTLYQDNPIMLFTLDSQGTVISVNHAGASQLGYTADELVGRTVLTVFYSDDHPAVTESLQTCLASPGKEYSWQFRKVRKDKSVIWVDEHARAITGSSKELNVLVVCQNITERKTTEAALRVSEEKFRALVETSPDIIWEIDPQGILRYVSPQVQKIMGYMPEEMIGRSVIDLIPKDEKPFAIKEMGRLFSLGGPLPPFDVRVRHRDGSELVLEIRPAGTGTDGIREGFRGVAVDITERRRAEEALRKSEEKFRALVETSRDMVWEIDPQGIFRYISPRVTPITGYAPEEIIGRSLLDLVPEERRAVMIQDLSRDGSLKGSRVPVEVPVRHRDGSELILEIRPAPADTDRKLDGSRGVAVDITERRRAEDELRKSEEKFRALVETSPDMIWEIDREGLFRYISPQVRAIMGYSPEELIGKSITDMIPEEFKPFVIRELARLSARGGSLPPFEMPSRHRDGHRIILEIRPSLTGDEGGRDGFRGVAVDITERKRVEETLSRANRQLQLLGSITRHDILNKVSVILGFLKITGMKCKDPAVTGYLKMMESTTTDIRSQIAFTKVYENIGTHEPQWIDLDAIMPRPHVPDPVSFNTTVQGTEIFSDPMLEKVFFNLLDNSIRHGQRVTEVRVSSHQSGENLVVVWEDNGSGIANDEKELIFERGFGKNTGLGMFLAREILSLTGITIKETGEPGKGARFEITVPKGSYRVSGIVDG